MYRLSIPLQSLVACILLAALCVPAQAQRPSGTPFIGLRGGATAYGGELDSCADYLDPNFDGDACELGWAFSDLGFGVGGELGYQFTRGLGFSLGVLYGQYENLDRDDAFNPDNQTFGRLNEGEDVLQVQGLFRLNTAGRVAPYLELGGAVVFGQGKEVNGDRIIGYGPVLGGGIDFLVGRKLSLYLGAQGQLVFPDDAVDNSDPSGVGLSVADEADFDALTLYGGGLRYFFRGGATRVDAFIDCAADLTVGEAGRFTATVNDDASEPLTYAWAFGDGATGSGLTASHAYSAPGTYTVSFTATGPANADTETCLVTVTEPQVPPALASCRVSPSRVELGEEVEVSASVSGTEPFEVSVDFGDGTVVEGLPASHAYSEGGTYTVTIRATNAFGSDTCTVTVTVADECDEVTELNAVFFDFGMSSLSAEARSRLDENIDVLRRCPDICVVINGYADPEERDKVALSEARAQGVYEYYVSNGVDADRLVARGLGEAPVCNPKEDPGPGDRNCRRAESIPVDCDRLNEMGAARPQPLRLDHTTDAPSSALLGTAEVVPAQGGVTWIVASTERAAAEHLAARYRHDGYRASVLAASVAGQTVYRVAVGQFASVEEARRTQPELPAYAPQDAWTLRLN